MTFSPAGTSAERLYQISASRRKWSRLRWTTVEAVPFRSENALECGDDSTVLLPALRHSECVENLGGQSKPDSSIFLTNREGGEEDQDYPVLAERESERGGGDLDSECPVPALEQKLVCWRSSDRESAQDEWPGGKI